MKRQRQLTNDTENHKKQKLMDITLSQEATEHFMHLVESIERLKRPSRKMTANVKIEFEKFIEEQHPDLLHSTLVIKYGLECNTCNGIYLDECIHEIRHNFLNSNKYPVNGSGGTAANNSNSNNNTYDNFYDGARRKLLAMCYFEKSFFYDDEILSVASVEPVQQQQQLQYQQQINLLLNREKNNLDEALLIIPTFYEALLRRAVINERLNHIQSAVNDLSKAVKDSYIDHRVYMHRARLYEMNSNTLLDAFNDYDRALALSNTVIDRSKALYARALLFDRVNRFEDAIRDTTIVLDENPSDLDSLFLRTTCYFKLGMLSRALSEVNKCIDSNTRLLTFYDFRAKIYLRLNNFEQALADLTTCNQLDPFNFEYVVRRCEIYQEMRLYDSALHDLDQLITYSPNYVPAILCRAQLFEKLNDYRKALSDYNQILTFEPIHAIAHFYRGSCYRKLGDLSLALQDLSLVPIPSTYPSSGSTDEEVNFIVKLLKEKILVYESMGDIQSVVTTLKNCIEVDRDLNSKRESIMKLCQILIKKQSFDEALTYAMRAIELRESDYTAWRAAGLILQYQGKQLDALRCLHEAHVHNPGAKGYFLILDRVKQRSSQANSLLE